MKQSSEWLDNPHFCEIILHYILPLLDLATLRHLTLTCNTLHDLTISHLKLTRNLLILPLTRSGLSEKHMDNITQLTGNIRYLDVSWCNLAVTSATLSRCLAANPNVKLLNISHCNNWRYTHIHRRCIF